MDVSVILLARTGGLQVVPSLRSIAQAHAEATEAGLSVEVLAVADRPDRLTEDCLIANMTIANGRYLRVDYGDDGITRNESVRRASGKWVAFLNEGDLFCSNWLKDALAAARAHTRPTVLHPELDLHFGEDAFLSLNPAISSAADDRLLRLVYENSWSGSFMTTREALLDLPFFSADDAPGIGSEPWRWYLRFLAAGGRHETVSGTCNFVRSHRTDLLSDPEGQSATLPAPSGCFNGRLSPTGAANRGR